MKRTFKNERKMGKFGTQRIVEKGGRENVKGKWKIKEIIKERIKRTEEREWKETGKDIKES